MSSTDPHGEHGQHDEHGTTGPAQPDVREPALAQPSATAYPAGYVPPPPASRTNVMAIVSMISSILGLTVVPFVGSVIGVVTGHIARRQIRESGEQGSGPANAGVALGWVGVGIALLLLVLLIVVLVGTWNAT